jgi:hypothetical protein
MNNDCTEMILRPREEAFCVAVLSGQNPSDAYRTVYKPQRAQAKTVHEMASRLMAKRKVRARLAELMEPVIERAQLSRNQWLESLALICLADVRKMSDEYGNPITITNLADAEAAAIAAFEIYGGLAASSDGSEVGGRTVRVRMVDKLKALELYGKAMGYFSDRRQIAKGPLIIMVEFVDPPYQLCPKQVKPVGEEPRSITECGRTSLTLNPSKAFGPLCY